MICGSQRRNKDITGERERPDHFNSQFYCKAFNHSMTDLLLQCIWTFIGVLREQYSKGRK